MKTSLVERMADMFLYSMVVAMGAAICFVTIGFSWAAASFCLNSM